MRLLCQHEGTQYVACGEFLVAITLSKEDSIRKFELSAGSGSQIIAVAVSLDGKFIYGGYSNKFICCWDTSTGTVLGSVQHSKRPTAIVYTESLDKNGAEKELRSALVVSDKAGLIWGMDVPLFRKQVLLAGHTASVITDMTTDGTFIATSDRDEKVRISNFPRMDTLQAFCMAHTNVVTSITFVKHASVKLLASCGWDHKLCLWNHVTGSAYDTLQYDPSGKDHSRLSSAVPSTITAAANLEPSVSTTADAAFSGNLNAVGEIEADADIEGDSPEDTTEKTYDENSAGHYPVKIVGAPDSSLVAVIFKDRQYLKIYSILKVLEVGSDSYSFGVEKVVELPSVPCDICFSSGDDLVVLLPKPQYLQIFSISAILEGNSKCGNDEVIEVKDFSDKHLVIPAFKALCVEKDLDFAQQLVSTVDGEDAEKGASITFFHFVSFCVSQS
jgi:WD40 repeat protein